MSRIAITPRCVAILAAVALTAAPARAVVIDSLTGTGNTTAPTDDPGWANVGVRGIGTGVYLGNGWVLTASHVGAGDIVLSGSTYAAVGGSTVQLTNGGESGKTSLTDLILYRLATVPAGLPGVSIATSAPAATTAVTMIGAGRDRGAFTEWTINQSTTPWTWTVVSSGGDAAGYQTLGTRAMRWGTNSIDGMPLWIAESDLAPPLDVRCLATKFQAFGSPSSEAQAVYGDSGGGVFAKSGGTWQLAGLILDVAGYSGQPDPGSTPVYGNVTYSADLAFYEPQIMAIVPEPAVLLPAGVVALVAALSCGRRR